MKNVEELVETIKTELTTKNFESAKEGMEIITKVLNDNGCKTLGAASDFCEKFNVEFGYFTSEHLVDRDTPFIVNGYMFLLNAYSMCSTERYYLANLKNTKERNDRARTVTNFEI